MPDKDVVAAVRARLAGRIGETRYDLWFGSQTRLVPQGDTLVVVAPNRFYQDWLRRNFREALTSSYRETVGCVARLEFVQWELDDVAAFRERFADPGKCVPDGWVRLRLLDADRMAFEWAFPDGRVDAATTLDRAR